MTDFNLRRTRSDTALVAAPRHRPAVATIETSHQKSDEDFKCPLLRDYATHPVRAFYKKELMSPHYWDNAMLREWLRQPGAGLPTRPDIRLQHKDLELVPDRYAQARSLANLPLEAWPEDFNYPDSANVRSPTRVAWDLEDGLVIALGMLLGGLDGQLPAIAGPVFEIAGPLFERAMDDVQRFPDGMQHPLWPLNGAQGDAMGRLRVGGLPRWRLVFEEEALRLEIPPRPDFVVRHDTLRTCRNTLVAASAAFCAVYSFGADGRLPPVPQQWLQPSQWTTAAALPFAAFVGDRLSQNMQPLNLGLRLAAFGAWMGVTCMLPERQGLVPSIVASFAFFDTLRTTGTEYIQPQVARLHETGAFLAGEAVDFIKRLF